MRVLRLSIFLSAILVATGVFLPYAQVGVGGISLGERSSMTLHGAVGNYTFVENAFASAEASAAERIASGLLAQVDRKTGGRLSGHLSAARSLLRDVRQVRESGDLERIGSWLRTAGYVFLALLALVAWLVLKTMARGGGSKSRAVLVTVLMGVTGILSIALVIAAHEGLKLANEELGGVVLSLGSGAYVMSIFSAIGFVAAAVSIKLEGRPARATSAAPIADAAHDEKRSSLSSE
jgi:hypothetical protein